MNKTYSALLGLLFVVGATGAHADFLNGSFENFSPSGANSSGSGYWTYNSGNTGINNWVVSGVSVDIVDSTYSPHAGSYALDLIGTPGPGSVAQAVTLASGNYDLSFWARANPDNTMNVTFDTLNTTLTGMSTSWTKYSFNLNTSGTKTLKLTSFSNGNGNLFIDDVSIKASAVPEPATPALLGLGLAAVGLRAKRKRAL